MNNLQSLRQSFILVLTSLWVLAIGYYPVRVMHYTFLDGLQTAVFGWWPGVPWWSRPILALPMISLIITTLLYVLKQQASPQIRSWMVRWSLRITGIIFISYNSFLLWGQDIVTLFIGYYLEVEIEYFWRGAQIFLGENFFWSYGTNLAFILGFTILNALYRQQISLERHLSPFALLPTNMPPVPADSSNDVLPPLPLMFSSGK